MWRKHGDLDKLDRDLLDKTVAGRIEKYLETKSENALKYVTE